MSIFQYQSLKFRIVSVLLVVFLIPIITMFYDTFYASKSDQVFLESKQLGLESIVDSLAPRLLDAIETERPDIEAVLIKEFNQEARPIADTHPGVRIGLYLPTTDRIYLQGFLHEYRVLTPDEQRQREERVYKEVFEGVQAVIAGGSPLSRIGRTWDDYFLEYLVPVQVNDELVAVVWAEQALHPIFAKSQQFRLFIRYVSIGILCVSAVGLLSVVVNLANRFWQIKQGLLSLEKDIHARLPEMPGEFGHVTKAINKMAQGLAEREELKEQLRRADSMAALGRLVTGISHELRNPLGVLKATIHVMEEDLKGDPGVQEYIRRIKHQIERQNNILNELLDFGRPGKALIEKLDVNLLLKGVLGFSQPLLQERKTEIETDFGHHLPLVTGSGEKLKQVFLNIILNAVQAVPMGGKLVISTRREEDGVTVTFRDNGPGIPESHLPYIFEPYYTTKDEGNGLGLAISFQIIEMHGGRIKAANAPTGGTVMMVYLPSQKGGEVKNGGESFGS